MRLHWFSLLVIVLVSAATAAQKKKSGSDDKALQGAWKVVQEMNSGKKLPDLDKELVELVFENGEFSGKVNGKTRGGKGSYKVYPDKSPKWIDLKIAGRSYKGIYEINGTKLRLCHGDNKAKLRPLQFISKANSQYRVLSVLERVKTKK